MTEYLTKEECIEKLKQIAVETRRPVTRNLVRAQADFPERLWAKHFGTFSEFKRQAGFDDTRQVRALDNAVARHSSVDHYRRLNTERKGYEDKYTRHNKSRFKTIIVASDFHDQEVDLFFLRVFLDTVKRVQPDAVSLAGDIFDLPEFGKYTVDPREWNVVERIQFVHDNILGKVRESAPEATIDLIEGNHESVEKSTEILTDEGWVKASDVTCATRIASYKIDSGDVTFNFPVAIKHTDDQPLISVKGAAQDELLFERHKIDYEGTLQYVDQHVGKKLRRSGFRHSANANFEGIALTDDEIRLIVWTVMDGCLVRRLNKTNGTSYTHHVQFKLSKPRKIEALRTLLDRMGIEYTFAECKKCGLNRLEPYYIRIYGEGSRKIAKLLENKKEIPASFAFISKSQLTILIETLRETDGHAKSENLTAWATTNLNDVDVIQRACVLNNVPCYYNKQEGRSGFSEGKVQYRVSIGAQPYGKVSVEREEYRGDIVSIQSENGTLITRRNGKVSFTGNCRLMRHLADATPAIRAVLSDLHGFTVEKLLGLNKYEVNYIAKADLSTYTIRDLNKELQNNYKIYSNAVLIHHHPSARNMGMPGANGHHHRHIVWPAFSPIFGAYEWHQLGCGHKRSASYTEGEKWHNGFAIVHIDAETKATNWEYIAVTDMAIVGGKWYHRESFE